MQLNWNRMECLISQLSSLAGAVNANLVMREEGGNTEQVANYIPRRISYFTVFLSFNSWTDCQQLHCLFLCLALT